MLSPISNAEIMGKSESENLLRGSPDKMAEERHNSHDSDDVLDMNGDMVAMEVKDEQMSCGDSTTSANEDVNEPQQEELISQTRTSVRVSLRKKEERKESEGSEDYDPNQHPFHGDFTDQNDQGNFMDVEGSSSPANHSKKVKRAWELWSSDDKNHFFEALNECGKNFDAMQQSFQTKKFKKNKEQIRTFYYRTWHKISKHINFPNDLKIKKSCCELYGLCNYGVLRKKTGSQLDDKYGANLQQLVFEGHTTVRVRGRMYRLKTPTCAALKKMKDLESGLNPTNGSISKSSIDSTIPMLPDKIVLKLEPNCYETFVYVNKAAFANPKVCITVSIQRRLSSVISYLEKKWKPLKEISLNSTADATTNGGSCDLTTSNPKNISLTSSCGQNIRLNKFTSQQSELWVLVRQTTKNVLPCLEAVEPITSASLSLSQLQQCNNSSVKMTTKNNNDMISKQNTNDIKTSDESNTSPVENMTVIQTTNMEKEDTKSSLRLIDTSNQEGEKPIDETDQPKQCCVKSIKDESEYDSKSSPLKEGLKEGWSSESAGSITIGELLLMIGGNQCSSSHSRVIELTYTWRPKNKDVSHDAKVETLASKDDTKLSNGNLIHENLEDNGFSAASSKSNGLLSYLAMFTGAELNRKQKGGKLGNRTPPNPNSMKSIIIPENQGPGKDIYHSIHPERKGVENGSLVVSNDNVSMANSSKQEKADMTVLNGESSNKVSNNVVNASSSTADSFRRPVDPPLRNLNAHQQHQRDMFRQQLDLLVPKYTQRKGRPLMRSRNIVSRQLPLQPKIVPQPLIKTMNGNVKIRLKSNQQHPIQLLQQNNTVIAIKESPLTIQVPTPSEDSASRVPVINLHNGTKNETDRPEDPKLDAKDGVETTANKVIIENRISPDKKIESPIEESPPLVFHNEDSLGSLSFLNDSGASNSGALHFRPSSAASDNANTMYDNPSSKMNGDNFLESVLEVSNGACSVLQTPPIHRSTSPPSSPPTSHLNNSHNSNSWLPELSLTSFLGNFGSSSRGDFNNTGNQDLSKSFLKMRHPSGGDFASHLINEDSQQSTGSEVDRQLLSMMTENSVDFTSKFEKLASAVTSDTSADA